MTHLDFLAIRKAAGMTQQEVADFLGVDRKTVQRYEADPGLSYGRRIPGPVVMLMRALRARPELDSRHS